MLLNCGIRDKALALKLGKLALYVIHIVSFFEHDPRGRILFTESFTSLLILQCLLFIFSYLSCGDQVALWFYVYDSFQETLILGIDLMGLHLSQWNILCSRVEGRFADDLP